MQNILTPSICGRNIIKYEPYLEFWNAVLFVNLPLWEDFFYKTNLEFCFLLLFIPSCEDFYKLNFVHKYHTMNIISN